MVNYGLYIIKDNYFNKFEDIGNIKKWNKRGRPQFLYLKDNKHTDIYWVIPLTTKLDKVKALIKKEEAEFGENNCIKAYILKVGGKKRGLLIQDMMPITVDYVDHKFTYGKNHVIIKNKKDLRIINSKSNTWLALIKQGRVFFEDQVRAIKIYEELVKECTLREVAIASDKKETINK